MIKPEKTINGTKWIETIQINAEERFTKGFDFNSFGIGYTRQKISS
ncbi:hypothetical protein S101106_02576 (plasmid) [Levilactobacillus brevis]|nr:hypothetical protein S101106_02576 [Levilactobacillus brevis]